MSKPNEVNDVARWELFAGRGYRERRLGDGLPILPHTAKLPAIDPVNGHLKVQRLNGKVWFIANRQDHVPGKRRATQASVALSRDHAEVLRDWLNAVLAEAENA